MKYACLLSLFLFGCGAPSENIPARKELTQSFMKGIWKGVLGPDGTLEEWVFMDGGLYKRNVYFVVDSKPEYGNTLDSLRWEMEGEYIYSFLKSDGKYQLDYHIEVRSDDSIKLTKGAMFKRKDEKYFRYFWVDGGIDTLNNFIRIDDKDTIGYSHSIVNGVYSEARGCNYSDDSLPCGKMFDTFGNGEYIYIKANYNQVGHYPLKRMKREMKDSL